MRKLQKRKSHKGEKSHLKVISEESIDKTVPTRKVPNGKGPNEKVFN